MSDPDSVISLWVKYTIFFVNFIIWVISLVMVGVGFWAFSEKYKSYGMVQVQSAFDLFLDISIVLMIVGGLVFLISFTGCIGALRENTCLLNLYSVILTMIFFAELALAIASFVFPHHILEITKEKLSYEVIEKYRDDENLQNLIDFMQEEFHCCGLSEQGYLDWNRNIYFNCSQHSSSIEKCSVPYSCCRNRTNIARGLVNTMCGIGAQNMEYSKVVRLINTRSCIDSIQEYMQRNLYTVGGIVIGVIIAQMFVLHMSRKLLGQVEYQKLCYERDMRQQHYPIPHQFYASFKNRSSSIGRDFVHRGENESTSYHFG